MESRLYRFGKLNSPLLQYARNVTSQAGEDGIIQRIFELISPHHKYCVEFGAWDGKANSNCHELIVTHGWRATMIEASTEKYRELTTRFGSNRSVTTVNRFVDFEGENTLDNILSESGAPADFDLLSIDIDGNDFHVWSSLTRHAPQIVVIEFNPTIPNDVYFVQDKSFAVNQGCSLLALTMLGKDKGYELAVCTGWNAFFIKKELFGAVGVPNNSISALYQPIQDGRIFQGFDGTIHVVGMDRLFWRQIPVSSEDFQVLPKSMRFFGDAQRKPQ